MTIDQDLGSTKIILPGEVEVALTELADYVRSWLSKLEGPLKGALSEQLHSTSKLPEASCYNAATEAVDLLHKAQKLLEPRTLILADHFLGYTNSKCLNAAIERGIPDILASGPATLEQLSRASSARPDRLRQVLRTLYNNGIFEYDDEKGLYTNNDASTLLCKDHPSQWRNWVNLYGNQFYDIARGIPQCTIVGESRSAAQIEYQTDLDMFRYFHQQGWTELLHRTLGAGAEAMNPGILTDYPWTDLADGSTVLLDIGGGGGGLIGTLLRSFKQLRGGIFDLPHVIDHAKELFYGDKGRYTDVGERVLPEHLIGGDFLKSVPSFEVYTMKWVLHDWSDEDSLVILRNIRNAIREGPKSRLIIMEAILADGRSSNISRYADINMMMTAGGQERTESEWRELAKWSGWDVRTIYTLRNTWFKAIELIPANGSCSAFGSDIVHAKRFSSTHDWVKHAMGGGLLHCPVNYSEPTLRILESGTGDGNWLVDMAAQVPSTAVLVGTDTSPRLFPPSSSIPQNIQLTVQSLADPWPHEFQSSFDVIHQRLFLSCLDMHSARKAISTLFLMIKPGGWIQLLEESGTCTEDQRRSNPATAKFYDVATKVMGATGKYNPHGSVLKSYLRSAGAANVVETIMDLPVGASKALTPEMQESTTQNMLSIVEEAKQLAPSLQLNEKDLDVLYHDLAEELKTRGSSQRLHLVYGQRPRNS